ncbi:phospholipase D-like domain-containing anti-phage protein [Anaerocellum danielii]|uniref:Phospholipase D-like domain-containing anti-phage protein n=1 Tax=Anaerocellum danielii TaxID=1387557 RepID=A0ABZ0TZ38_9FIRM|nr:phospholipase D-like domain-containing anti-phage protein [Caldicellulosiruptor danielii]WPX07743.1 phospholipase D-like domain-containing anti-phage protein [Caldicellulosiruptor danielii]
MLERYSSRHIDLAEEFLNKHLKNAKSYDRLAGYFSSSILEIAGETIESIEGVARVVCNSEVESKDVLVAKLAKQKLVREWFKSKPEQKVEQFPERFKKLYELLKSGKLQVRVLPNDIYGLVHGKAGVITLSDGRKIAFVGSVNETAAGWKGNYEILWADDSIESVEWVQNEFDFFWNNPYACEFCDLIIENIGRLAERNVVSIEEWQKEPDPAAPVIEAPVYREGFGLWNHQKYFVKMVFEEHCKDGARYILADEVGLGKTAQLGMIAQLTALYGDRPVLVIVPKTLLWQWQDELKTMFDIPSAVWDGKRWIVETGQEYRPQVNGIPPILQCPRRIGIISQGLITSNSDIVKPLLDLEYECVIVDEAHRARRQNLNRPGDKPEPNNLMKFLLELSQKTKTMILATATPIQLHPIEGWDLLYILAQGSAKVLGDAFSLWQLRPLEGIDYVRGAKEISSKAYYWSWIRNPLPPSKENPFTIGKLRRSLGMSSDEYVSYDDYDALLPSQQDIIDELIEENFMEKYNPFIRHIVKRKRSTLENTVDPETGEPYLKKIEVVLFGEGDDEGLVLSAPLKKAYEYAEEFTNLLRQKTGAKGFYKTLLLRRMGSSMQAGLNTAKAIYEKRAIVKDDFSEEDEDDDMPDRISITGRDELFCLEEIIDLLEYNKDNDPKLNKILHILNDMGWLERGCIIFSEYFDTAWTIAQKLSSSLPNERIAIYAGGDKSGIIKNGIYSKVERDEIKELVLDGKIRLMIGTDAAAEGLNLQTLGALINVDLPWNPIRLEQRQGRIRRIGQQFDKVYVYNLRYKDSIEDRIHAVLSGRIKLTYDIIGSLPEIIKDEWMEIVKTVEVLNSEHPFDIKYREHVEKVDWESCKKVLDNEQRKEWLMRGWRELYFNR